MSGPIVAIDGAAGSGKSTLARALAKAAGVPYLNTGLMYRALTLAALDAGVDLDDGKALAHLTRRLRFGLSVGDPPEIHVDGSAPAPDLNSARVDAAVSRVSRHPPVRAIMREMQRELGSPAAVVEGRDIATVVFPDADAKIYLAADPTVRAERRRAEREADPSDVERSLHARDERDATVNPFEPASGATVIDTTDLSPQDVLARALEIVRSSREA